MKRKRNLKELETKWERVTTIQEGETCKTKCSIKSLIYLSRLKDESSKDLMSSAIHRSH